MKMIEKSVLSFDNTLLFARYDLIDNPKGLIIIVHGVSESSDRYRHVASTLNDFGYDVISFDNRGNARSGGAVGDCHSFLDFIEDTHYFVQENKDKYQKIYLLGHSMGGFIVNAYVCKYQDISGVISSGAVGIYLDQVKAFRYIPFKPFKKLWIKNNLSNDLCHDEEVSKAYVASPYVNKRNRVNLFGECFVKGVKFIYKNYQNYQGPILYLHGEDDKIVPVKSSKYLYEISASKDKDIKIYEGFYHEIFNEIGKEKVFSDVKGWLDLHE